MPMVPLYSRFPEIAFHEMRSVMVPPLQEELPAGMYGFLELFCDEPGCDCRRAFIQVITPEARPTDPPLATINYGWESAKFYAKWIGGDREAAREMRGASLAPMSVQSDLAPALLNLFELALRDQAYVERIQRHYRLFRQSVDG